MNAFCILSELVVRLMNKRIVCLTTPGSWRRFTRSDFLAGEDGGIGLGIDWISFLELIGLAWELA